MTDLTKDMTSYAWSMTVFTASQMASLMVPTLSGRHPATVAFRAVASAAEGQLGCVSRPIFRAGDAFQRWAVDMTANLVCMQPFMPGRTGPSGTPGCGK
jgi:hypothetical protein